MSTLTILILSFFPLFGMPTQDSGQDWATKTFSSPSDRVFGAALKSIAAQRYQVQEKNEENRTVRFTVGRSAFSWGYIMLLKVSPSENNTSKVSVEVARMRGPGANGKVSLVASGKKEVQKVFQGIEKELAKEPVTEKK